MNKATPTTILKTPRKIKFEHSLLLTFFIFFLLFNWEILLALTGINESISIRVEYIRHLNLGALNFIFPFFGALTYLFFGPKIQVMIERSSRKIFTDSNEELRSQKLVQKNLDLQKEIEILFKTYSEIGLAGKSVIDETLIYSTAQENFLKKSNLSAEEVIWVQEELCSKYQDSLKKIQELMIVLAMRDQAKILAMQQRIKDEKRI